MKSVVRLDTTEMWSVVSIHQFQFGTVPAPMFSYGLLVDSVSPGTIGQDIFWFDSDMEIDPQQELRFNIRFELNIHNSANLQIRLSPNASGTETQWRWSAPIGYCGTWSSGKQQAPWFDDAMDYCITLSAAGTGLVVALGERAGSEQQQCEFIPSQDKSALMVRSPSGSA